MISNVRPLKYLPHKLRWHPFPDKILTCTALMEKFSISFEDKLNAPVRISLLNHITSLEIKMYERLLDKTITPSFDDLIAYSADSGALWLELDTYLQDVFSAKRQIRFPYGNDYGWSCKYSLKGKHICDVFAENGAFALHFRIGDQQLESVYSELSEYAKNICDNKYPCTGGGWLTYQVLSQPHLIDAIKLVSAKLNLNTNH